MVLIFCSFPCQDNATGEVKSIVCNTIGEGEPEPSGSVGTTGGQAPQASPKVPVLGAGSFHPPNHENKVHRS